jgi:uncharacterized membrane protein
MITESRKQIKNKQEELNLEYRNSYVNYQSNKSESNLDDLDDKAREILTYVDTIASKYNTDQGEEHIDYQYVVETCFDSLEFMKFHFTYLRNEKNENTIISKTAYSDLMRLARKINSREKKKQIKKYIDDFRYLEIPIYGLKFMTIQTQKKLTFSALAVIACAIIFMMAVNKSDNLFFMYGLVFNTLYIILIMMFSSREKILLLSLVFYVTLPMTIFSLPFDSSINFDFGVVKANVVGAVGVFLLLLYKSPIMQIYDFLNKNNTN